jgi:hypothetical protein
MTIKQVRLQTNTVAFAHKRLIVEKEMLQHYIKNIAVKPNLFCCKDYMEVALQGWRTIIAPLTTQVVGSCH